MFRQAAIFIASFLFLLTLSLNESAFAQMKRLENDELSNIDAKTGINFWVKDFTFDLSIGSFKYTDTDTGNALELKNISLHDGSGNAVYFSNIDDSLITYDIFTVDDPSLSIDGKTMLSIQNPDWTQKLSYTIENFVFCTTDLGRIDIGNIHRPSSYFLLTPNGRVGPAWELAQELMIDEIRYTYQGDYTTVPGTTSYEFSPSLDQFVYSGPTYTLTNPTESLVLKNIYLSETAGGTVETPSTWTFDGKFRIGDVYNNNPATLDIVTIISQPGGWGTNPDKTVMAMNFPMSGSLRIEEVNFGGTNFGPCAIDGINVHRLSIEIAP